MKMVLSMAAVLFSAMALTAFGSDYPGAPCFTASYNIDGLKPSHNYVLTINGYSDHKSNKILLGMGELWQSTGEGYCDFVNAMTDENGVLSVNVQKVLPKGEYKVKFLVKDPYNDWKVVWNEDEIKFQIN